MLSPKPRAPRAAREKRACHPVELTASEVRLILTGRKSEIRLPLMEVPLSLASADLLWVREAVKVGAMVRPGWLSVHYLADGAELHVEWPRVKMPPGRGIRAPAFMIEPLSRLTLSVVAVRSERLHALTPESALAEGMLEYDGRWMAPASSAETFPDHRACHAAWWDKRHGESGGLRWAANPEVAVIRFAGIRANVAAMMAGRGAGGA